MKQNPRAHYDGNHKWVIIFDHPRLADYMWTGSGLKPGIRMWSGLRAKEFSSEAEANAEIKNIVLDHIVKYKDDFGQYIRGWDMPRKNPHRPDLPGEFTREQLDELVRSRGGSHATGRVFAAADAFEDAIRRCVPSAHPVRMYKSLRAEAATGEDQDYRALMAASNERCADKAIRAFTGLEQAIDAAVFDQISRPRRNPLPVAAAMAIGAVAGAGAGYYYGKSAARPTAAQEVAETKRHLAKMLAFDMGYEKVASMLGIRPRDFSQAVTGSPSGDIRVAWDGMTNKNSLSLIVDDSIVEAFPVEVQSRAGANSAIRAMWEKIKQSPGWQQ